MNPANGAEFSPHGVIQHVCVFGALALLFSTSAYGIWVLASKALGRSSSRRTSEESIRSA